MRMMAKGQPFMDVGSEAFRDGRELPTFSEGFLYERVGKDEARFILAVAEEYEHVIQALGPAGVQRILDVKPKLARRLGAGAAVSECLADAKSTDLEYREREFPDVTLDHDSAHAVWKLLHDEYCRHFDPENSLDKDRLRLYHRLTDDLGSWEQGQRQKEIDRLPEKLERQTARRANLAAKRAGRAAEEGTEKP